MGLLRLRYALAVITNVPDSPARIQFLSREKHKQQYRRELASAGLSWAGHKIAIDILPRKCRKAAEVLQKILHDTLTALRHSLRDFAEFVKNIAIMAIIVVLIITLIAFVGWPLLRWLLSLI